MEQHKEQMNELFELILRYGIKLFKEALEGNADLKEITAAIREYRGFLKDNHITLTPAEPVKQGDMQLKTTLPFKADQANIKTG